MAKVTKAEREAIEAQREIAILESIEAFKKKMPERLMTMQGLATSAGVQTTVSLTVVGPNVRFEYDDGKTYIDETISYESEEWQVESLECRIDEIRREKEAKAERHKLAQDTFNALSKQQKEALKEFIRFLV